MKCPLFFPSIVVLPIMLTLGSCGGQVQSLDRVQAGMNRDQVQSIIGLPDSVAHASGNECAYYSLLKDFWRRVPWSTSDRYYVCYAGGKVATFGKVDGATSAG